MLKSALSEEITSYSISFSQARDLLSQWSMYAGESGVSIRMNFSGGEEFRGYSAEGGERTPLTDDKTKVTVQKVYYCTKDVMEPAAYQKVAEEICQKITDDSMEVTQKDMEANYLEIWKKMTPYVKRAEFRAEEEYRLVFEQRQWKTPFRIDYRNSENVLKPYLDVECVGGWPVCEIVIGPGFNQEVVFNSVLHFLNNTSLRVPKLGGRAYQERCWEYFISCGKMPQEVQQVWDQNSGYLLDENNRYKTFLDIRKKILMLDGLDEAYKEQMGKCELTKDGILLSRSRIPYIF
ncbi:MAG: hypothetical protein NC417_00255 [Candidatus Gastranaerophilales bacterium]|nr:hypothetical protein [Candidatus Gastranaerophilales bacterium]